MNNIKVLIVDDDIMWRKLIANLCYEMFPFIDVICANYAVEALTKIKREAPEIVLLDIEMPYGNGFEMLEALSVKNFELVFITGHNYNQSVFNKYSPVGVIMKPVGEQSLKYVMSLCFDKINNQTTSLKYDFANINIMNIVRIEAKGSYSIVHFVSGKTLVISKNLAVIEKQLSNPGLFRVHRSHIINLYHVDKYTIKGKAELILKDGTSLPIGIKKKNDFISAINNIIEVL